MMTPVPRRGKNVFMARATAVLACAALLAPAAALSADFDCMIEARQTVEIRSSVEAVIESVKVQRGSIVTKGQVVATLESGPERAAFALAEERARNKGELNLSEARLDLAAKKFKRADELHKQNFISSNARDEAQAEFRLASEEVLRAKENQRLAALEAQRAREVLAMRTIRSPVNGVVVEVMRKPGEFGAISFKDPIMRLAEIDPLHVEVVLPVSLYGRIKPGMKGVVVPENSATKARAARVKVVDRVVDAASGTFGVRLELPNPERSVPAGVKCKVRFE